MNTEAILQGKDGINSSNSSKAKSGNHQSAAGNSDSRGSNAYSQSQKSSKPSQATQKKPSNVEAAFGRNPKDIPYNLPKEQRPHDSGDRTNNQYQSHRKSQLDYSRPVEGKSRQNESGYDEPAKKTENSGQSSRAGKLSDNARHRDTANEEPGWSTAELDFESKPQPRGRGRAKYTGNYGDRGRDSRHDGFRRDDRDQEVYQKQPKNQNGYDRNWENGRDRGNNYQHRPNYNGYHGHYRGSDHRDQRASYRPSTTNGYHKHPYQNREVQGLIDENAGRKGETKSLYETLRHNTSLEEYLRTLPPDNQTLPEDGSLA